MSCKRKLRSRHHTRKKNKMVPYVFVMKRKKIQYAALSFPFIQGPPKMENFLKPPKTGRYFIMGGSCMISRHKQYRIQSLAWRYFSHPPYTMEPITPYLHTELSRAANGIHHFACMGQDPSDPFRKICID